MAVAWVLIALTDRLILRRPLPDASARWFALHSLVNWVLCIAGIQDVFSVAGTTFRASAVEAVLKEGVRDAMLEPEPTNRFDKNAVKVLVNGHHVGYVPAVRAASTRGPVHVCNIGIASQPHVWLSMGDRKVSA